MAMSNWLPRWWWVFLVLIAAEFAFVEFFKVKYKLQVGNPTYAALIGLAFVFAPTFFNSEVDPKQKTLHQARREAEARHYAKQVAKEKAEKKAPASKKED